MLTNAAPVTMPSGRVFEEKISTYRTPSGFVVSVSQWIEILVIKVARAKEETLEDTIKNYIKSLSEFYGVDSTFMISLARCESNFQPEVVGDTGKALGIYQGWAKSWAHYNKIYKTNLDRTSWIDQTKMSIQVVRDYGSDDWQNCTRYIREGSWSFLKK